VTSDDQRRESGYGQSSTFAQKKNQQQFKQSQVKTVAPGQPTRQKSMSASNDHSGFQPPFDKSANPKRKQQNQMMPAKQESLTELY